MLLMPHHHHFILFLLLSVLLQILLQLPLAAALLLAKYVNTPGFGTASIMRATAAVGACSEPHNTAHRNNPKYPSGGAQSTVNDLAKEIRTYSHGKFLSTTLPPAYAAIEARMQAARGDGAAILLFAASQALSPDAAKAELPRVGWSSSTE